MVLHLQLYHGVKYAQVFCLPVRWLWLVRQIPSSYKIPMQCTYMYNYKCVWKFQSQKIKCSQQVMAGLLLLLMDLIVAFSLTKIETTIS